MGRLDFFRSRHTRQYSHFTLALLLLSLSSLAQVKPRPAITHRVYTAPDKPINYHLQDASKAATDTTHGHYIIKFKSDPDLKNKSGRRGSNLDFEHDQFAKDLKKIDGAHQMKSSGNVSGTSVDHHFKKTFNGKAITASGATAEEIRKLTYVDYVIEDKQVKISDENSNAIIEADKVWSQLNITGSGVVIGIIDTGVDYNHPDISDGIGAGHKVLGGYDFVNNDNDPMDDNGHGTHVSGIAAANGPNLKGVAPGAQLMSFKVLNADGWGLTSWIIAGIERSVDPDQNPATDDKVDVVNMSLGGATSGPDPMSDAVDNAVNAGVVFVIAAGNDGYSGYESIGSPGIAANAITVGATDSNDVPAGFSSKGPAPGSYSLKPDLVAPGVDIYSSFANEGYASLSGTSMATPHVVGAVALLLQLHPDWSPLQIKASLMQNATPLPLGPLDVGAGRLDVLKAAQATYGISPGSVSLGLLDRKQPTYATSIPLTVSNVSSQEKTFNLFADGDLNFPGVITTIDKTTLTLGGNESQVINVQVSIQTASLPIRDLPDLYLGSINISDNTTSYKVPIGFANPNQITVHFADPLPAFLVVFGADNYFFKFYYPTSETVSIPLLPGNYNFVSYYANRYVVREDISIPDVSDLSMGQSDAVNVLVFQPVDENGKKIPLQDNMLGHAAIGYYQPGSAGFFSVTGGAVDTIYTSNLTARWGIGFDVFDNVTQGSSRFYSVAASDVGVTQSKTYTNNPSDFIQLKYDYDHQPNVPIDLTSTVSIKLGGVTIGTSRTIQNVSPDVVEFHQKVEKSNQVVATQQLILAANNSGYNFQTPALSVYNNDSVAFYKTVVLGLTEGISQPASSFNLKLNETLLQWGTTVVNTDTTVMASPYAYDGYFLNNRGDKVLGKINYTLSNAAGIVKSSSVVNPSQGLVWNENGLVMARRLTPDNYTLIMEFDDYQVQGTYGKATAECHFNTSLNDKNPPSLSQFELTVNGKFTNQFLGGDQAILTTGVTDDYGIDQYKVEFKKLNDNSWSTLPGNAAVDLPTNLDDGFYSLRVSAFDNAGNYFVYSIEPAFLVGSNPNPVPFQRPVLIYPANNSVRVAQNSIFFWNKMSAASYTVQVATDSTFLNMIQNVDLANDSIRFSTLFSESTKYFWRVQGKYTGGSATPWSDISSFTTGSGSVTASIKLLAPINDRELDTELNGFSWTAAPGAVSYQLQLLYKQPGNDAMFSDYSLSGTDSQITLLPGQEWHWRVRPNYASIDGEWTAYSFFNTGLSVVTPLTPANNSTVLPASASLDWSATFSSGVYHILLSTSSDMSNPVIDQMAFTKPYPLTGLIDSTTYFWKVDIDYSGVIASSPIWSFKTRDVLPLGVAENTHLKLYPNPASATVNFELESSRHDVVITNSLGQQVWSHQGTEPSFTWNLTGIESGIYIAQINDGGKMINKKIVVCR